MPDPDVLEKRLLADLETIQRYKELMARHGGENVIGLPSALPPAGSLRNSRRPRPPKRQQGRESVAAISLRSLGSDWSPVTDLVAKVRELKPKATRSSVVTALNRFAESGRAERRKGPAGHVEYRRKAATE